VFKNDVTVEAVSSPHVEELEGARVRRNKSVTLMESHRAAVGEVELTSIFDRQRSAFLRQGPPSLAQRKADLRMLKEAILARRDQFSEAVNQDFGHRSHQETAYMDLMPVVEGIGYLRRNLATWMQPEVREVAPHFQPSSNQIMYQPLGVVGIISPWNHPVALALMPLATALAAGNRAMLKPSELTPATSALLAAMLADGFAEDQVAVITGDAEVAAAFSSLPFDRILFTGSTAVGRAVMRTASANLTPVTLELGGKSPAIVQRGSSLQRAAHNIAFGKLANAGQTCIAPDYVLVAAEDLNAFVAAFESEVAVLYYAIAINPDYATIINDRHYSRLRGLLDDARAKGAHIRQIGPSDDQRRTHPRTFLPVVVTGVTQDMALATEEIFGPILPVIPYRTLEEAIAFVNARPRPLALYFFGAASGPALAQVLERTTSGNVTVNDTLLHYVQDDLPFGGVGASGMGTYHGHEGFKTMSHAKGVFVQSGLNITDAIRPPFGETFDDAVNQLLR
jgi:coniferyl-aldehyde dehydrogenase